MAVDGSIDLGLRFVETATNPLGSTLPPLLARIALEPEAHLRKYAAGTATGNVEDIAVEAGNVTAGSAVTVDLNGSSSPSPLGTNPAMTTLMLLWIENTSTSGGSLKVTSTTGLFAGGTDELRIPPGTVMVVATRSDIDGVAVAAGSTDTITIDATAGTLGYRVIAIGHH